MKRLLATTVIASTAIALAATTAPSAATPAAPAASAAAAQQQADQHAWVSHPSRTARPAGWPTAQLGPRPTVQVGGHTYPAADPYLALLPTNAGVDWSWWRQHLQQQSARRAARQGDDRLPEPLVYVELEPADTLGDNDSPENAEPIGGFGTGAGELAGVSIFGNQARDRVEITAVSASREDDGAIPLARSTGVDTRREGIRTTGRVGDGPHGASGSGSGDFDYYRVHVPRGQQIVTRMDARGESDVDPLIAIWGEKGGLKDVAFGFRHHHADLTTPLPAGTYFVMTAGCCPYPRNRFKSGSGTGAESEGGYRFSVAVNRPDRDFYAVDLEAGDVLGGTVKGAKSLSVYAPNGTKVFGSGFDASSIYPSDTPLPGGGRAVVDHVAATSGTYTVGVTFGQGEYQADLEVYRPGLEQQGSVQTLFLDFDGARLNTNIVGGPGVRQLSPLSAFLERWGLGAAREDAVIDATVATVQENLDADIQAAGLSGSFDINILNSRDDADPFGEPDVSRLIVGGSIRESGIPTIGIAQSIDPGNFNQEETALLLLDELSGPEENAFSINHWLTPRSHRVAFVGQVLGNLVAHEAGHFLGNWHVDQFDGDDNLMDQGGGHYRGLFGPGPDKIGGTADDTDTDYGVNRLNPFEGFEGRENTLARTAYGLSDGLACAIARC